MATALFTKKSWHWRPTMYLTLEYTATRADSKTAKVDYNFKMYNIMGGSGATYAASNALGVKITVDGDSSTFYVIGNGTSDNNNNISFSRTNTSTTGESDVTVYVWCHQGTYASPTGTSNNCNAASGSKNTDIGGLKSCPYHGTWTGKVSYPAYNPYTPSSIWLNPNDYTKISKVNDGSWSVHYSYNAGSNSNVPISLAIHDYDKTSWGVRWEPVLRRVNGSSDGVWDNYTLKTDQGFSDGDRYRITLVSNGGEALSPSSWDPRDGLVIYTYRIPTVNSTFNIVRTEQNAAHDNQFSITGTNNRKWGDGLESEFQTRYRIKRGNDAWSDYTNIGNTDSWYRTATEMRSLVNKNYDGQAIQIQFERYSPSAEYESSNKPSGTFYIYYRPRLGIPSSDTTYKDGSGSNISKGKVIDSTKLTDMTVSWTYGAGTANNGVPQVGYTQGYRVRLYNNAGNVVKTYYTTSKSYKIPKGDIPNDGLLTYIDITPYFGNDQPNLASATYANNYWYYTGNIERMSFIIVASRLKTPTITYPIHMGVWMNDDFRICFQLPDDPNRASISGTYKYDNIEFEINNKVYKIANTDGTTSGSTLISNNYTLSTLSSDLTYQKKVTIWPNANGITPALYYTIRLRVRKPYNATSDMNYGWSDWSSKITIYKLTPEYSVSSGDIITATHFNDLRDAVQDAQETYDLHNYVPDRAVFKTTIISQSQYWYDSIFRRIVEVKDRVNNYAPISSGLERVRLDNDNRIITSFNTLSERITANKDTSNGRNYMKYLYDNIMLLK